MKKTSLFVCLAALLWGTSAAISQENCTPCDPCGVFGSPFTFGGWVESGIYTNGNGGGSDNGPMHAQSNRRTDFLMNQLYLFGEKAMNTKHGLDWGARADFAYGVDAPDMQCFGDETFDFGWGNNRHGYGASIYQLYGTLGYKDLSVKVGKFITPVGWEGVASKDNTFYSHSLCYYIEPSTHSGALATYKLTDRLEINAGWTAGRDASFKNPNNNSAVLTGFTYSLTDNANVYYWINTGKEYNSTADRNDYFSQSLCFEWKPTSRFTYVFEYDLRNDNTQMGRSSTYGLNNHFLYALTDDVTAGLRLGWARDNADYIFAPGDYYEMTWGLDWKVLKNVNFRPEVRYDWCKGASPYGAAGSLRKDQVSGGFGVLVSF